MPSSNSAVRPAKAATVDRPIYFAIRDDDTCYFTSPGQLESCYGHIWNHCPISLSVVPMHARTKSGALPQEYWSGDDVYPLEQNGELCTFLRDSISRGRVHVTLHGYHHRDEQDGFEFETGADLSDKARQGREYLEDLLGQPISVFVPPHNALSRRGLQAVLDARLHLSGIQSFRPSIRGYDPGILWIGTRRRWWKKRHGFNQPWPVVFSDRHCELPHTTLTPRISAEQIVDEFDNVARTGGAFCLATHYWEFDRPGQGHGYTIRRSLDVLWQRVRLLGDRVRFVSLSQLCQIALQQPFR